MNRYINFRVSPEMLAKLQFQANLEGLRLGRRVTCTELVRNAIERHLLRAHEDDESLACVGR